MPSLKPFDASKAVSRSRDGPGIYFDIIWPDIKFLIRHICPELHCILSGVWFLPAIRFLKNAEYTADLISSPSLDFGTTSVNSGHLIYIDLS